MSLSLFVTLGTNILMIYKKHCHDRGLKCVFWKEKDTTDPFQLKITLDNYDSAAVDLFYDLTNT